MAGWIVDLLPPHRAYAEVFAGGLHVLFKKAPSPIETVNDLDGNLMNFWKVLRDPETFERFQRMCLMTPYAKQQFIECRDTWRGMDDPVERAWAWFVTVRQAFSSMADASSGWSYSTKSTSPSAADRWVSAVDRLPAVHKRIRKLQVESRDFRDFIPLYGREGVLLYVDPPYVPETRTGGGRYSHEMSREDHHDLTELLLSSPAMVVLSGYRDEQIHGPLEQEGWQRYEKKTVAWSVNNEGGERGSRTESIWINPHARSRAVTQGGLYEE